MERKQNRLTSFSTGSMGVFAVIMICLAVYGLFIQEKGAIEVIFNDELFAISMVDEPAFIHYANVENAEVIKSDGFAVGERLDGREGKRYIQGSWHNETLGEYSLSVNTKSASYILLRYDGKVIVFSGNSTTQTEEYFQTLLTYIGQAQQ